MQETYRRPEERVSDRAAIEKAKHSQANISLRTGKSFAERQEDSAFKEIMLGLPDEVTPEEFQVLLPVLLRLLKRAQSDG